MSKHKEIFSKIYADNTWGGSGGGSMPNVTVEYRNLIESFLKEKNIESVIDFGCGDWMFSHLINWGETFYTGIDCVQSVIDSNVDKYGTWRKKFICYDHIVGGPADLLILKDVLQHWTNQQVVDFIDANIKDFRFILITNNSNQTADWQDSDTPHIVTRDLSAKFFPLKKWNPVVLLETNINEPKETCLIERP